MTHLNPAGQSGDVPGQKVDFLICGAQKCGTTALHDYLQEHPRLCMSQPKEVHYFDDEARFARQEGDDAWYGSHFTPAGAGQLLGEATPIYMYWQAAPERIWKYNPGIKLIVLLRNPIERAFSQWNMQFQRGEESRSFMRALQNEEEWGLASPMQQHRVFSYMDRGFYSKQIEKLWSLFGKKQVLILAMEELRQNPQAVLDKVCDFLDVESFMLSQPRDVHARPYAFVMGLEERKKLREVFGQEILKLEDMLPFPCKKWLDNPRTPHMA